MYECYAKSALVHCVFLSSFAPLLMLCDPYHVAPCKSSPSSGALGFIAGTESTHFIPEITEVALVL